MLEISSTSFIFLKTFNSEFQAIEVWFTDENRQPLENKFNCSNQTIQICDSTEARDRIYVKGYGFLSFAKNMSKHLRNKYSQKLKKC